MYRLKIDSCNRLWAVDAGVSRSLEDFEVTCPPKILVYDLNTDRVVRRIDFPAEVVRNDSLFTNIVIDETASRPENQCDDVMVYITDTVAPGMDNKKLMTRNKYRKKLRGKETLFTVLINYSLFADPLLFLATL